jgi:hypothetical protein
MQPMVNNEKAKNPHFKALDDLNELGRSLLENSLSQTPNGKSISQINQMKTKKLNEIIPEEKHVLASQTTAVNVLEDSKFLSSFNTLYIELESIRPAIQIQALNLYEKNNLKTVLHFARDIHLDFVYVIVISTTSTNLNEPLKNYLFQAAVTKVISYMLSK